MIITPINPEQDYYYGSINFTHLPVLDYPVVIIIAIVAR